jgi:hypothetical protein
MFLLMAMKSVPRPIFDQTKDMSQSIAGLRQLAGRLADKDSLATSNWNASPNCC